MATVGAGDISPKAWDSLMRGVELNYICIPGSPEAKRWARRQRAINKFVDEEIGSELLEIVNVRAS